MNQRNTVRRQMAKQSKQKRPTTCQSPLPTNGFGKRTKEPKAEYDKCFEMTHAWLCFVDLFGYLLCTRNESV